jgi:hypothetical protein
MARKVVVAVAVVGAGQHDGADARDRLGPCLAEHRLGRSAAVSPVRDMRAAMKPATTGVAKDVPLQLGIQAA